MPSNLTGLNCWIFLVKSQPAAANALLIKNVVIIPASFPKTRALLKQRGFCVRTIDLSELQKAEAGVTCCSLIFDHDVGLNRVNDEHAARGSIASSIRPIGTSLGQAQVE